MRNTNNGVPYTRVQIQINADQFGLISPHCVWGMPDMDPHLCCMLCA